MTARRFLIEFASFVALMTVCGVLMVVGFAIEGNLP